MADNATRANIVSAADRLFYEHGFEHTSFADVAEMVGISRGNFYHHFKSKDLILDAVVERRLADRQAMLDRWEIEGQTPQRRIESFIRIILVNEAKIRAYGCPVGTLYLEMSKLEHEGVEGARRIFDLFRIWLARQFILMGRPEDADDLAMHILARSQGVATLANAYPAEDFLEREVEQMCAWLDALASSTQKSPSKRS